MSKSILFLHTADIHLGAPFSLLGEKASLQRNQLRTTYNKIIEKAIEHKVRFVLFSGDTFDSNKPSPESVATFKAGIEKLAQHQIPAIIIGGTHDGLEGQAVLKKLSQSLENKLVLLDDTNPFWLDESNRVCVYGISQLTADHPDRPLEALMKIEPQKTKWHIGMVHGSINIGQKNINDATITQEEIKKSNLDYLALGHWHNTQEYTQGKTACWYSGSPEMIAMDEKGQGNVLVVELDEEKQAKVTPVTVGERYLLNEEINITHAGLDTLIDKVSDLANPQHILTLTIIGEKEADNSVDLNMILEKLSPLFFYVRLKDKTHVQVSEEELSRYSENTVIGKYVRMINDELKRSDEERKQDLQEALQLGVALIQGREVKLWS